MSALLSGSACVLASVALAQPAAKEALPASADEIDEVFLNSLYSGTARENYLASVARPFRSADRDGDGLDREDIEREKLEQAASMRASAVSGLLRFDFDGDLKVTRQEILENVRGQTSEDRERQADYSMERYDRNSDGVATIEEALMSIDDDRGYGSGRSEDLLKLDPNGDGRVTIKEVLSMAGAVFDRFDPDENGLIDKDEADLLEALRQSARDRQRLSKLGCAFPAASDQAELVSLGAATGGVVSNVFVGGKDQKTGIVDVVIEDGETPLYLLLGSRDAMIWRFSGVTKRVEQAYASSIVTTGALADAARAKPSYQRDPLPSAAGAIGIDKDRFTVGNAYCLRGSSNWEERYPEAANRLAMVITGREMDRFVGEFRVASATLPSGGVTKADYPKRPKPDENDPEAWKEAAREVLKDVADIDPADVVSTQPVGVYDILPGDYGIAQMIVDGTLKRDAQGRFALTRNAPVWPANFRGSRSLTFVVKDGVTVPEEIGGRSCVLTEEQAAKDDWRETCVTVRDEIEATRPTLMVPPPAPAPPIRLN
ncbi:MAG: hypothetical protein WBA51_01200 [Erythrobacter sp.]